MAQKSFSFDYESGVVCRIPDTLKDDAVRESDQVVVDIDHAKREHEKYILTLRKLKINLLELEADEEYPDCCFVEDIAVIHDGVALICKPKSPSRRGEVEVIKRVLSHDLGQHLVNIKDENALIEGGNVLFTGKEFFVGISPRTNQAGALALAKAFPDYNVATIQISGCIHLKSLMSMAGPGIIAIGQSEEAKKALKQIVHKANHDYETVTLPDDEAANCLYVNRTLIHCTEDEFPESYKIFEDRFADRVRIALPNRELAKVQGSLTGRSLLVGKKRKNPNMDDYRNNKLK
ncbi:N(G),N(G)-dimethylarginine dimethylaminohydrolase 1-like [Anneissia japonica]|uniref:N(G),N(G)-dimethylarginine dimethylaminohydrolase 1-like n=1 Tax=Anneissia japonica TaxID=1529436 RepID=UPI001425AEE7|nr:N(G),N(G)-dimethylarginine dimethylaminohydrolase 1-like [Anneissia japonica]